MSFRFRQFTVDDTHSTLRVGTDSMLLGSWANPGMAETILDIGTGCGVLAAQSPPCLQRESCQNSQKTRFPARKSGS